MRDGRKLLDSLKKVGYPPAHVFELLRRGVGDIRKNPERRNVVEITAVQISHVAAERLAAANLQRGLLRIVRDSERCGEIVRRARRDISQKRAVLDLHQAVDRLVERAVPAAAHQEREIRRTFPGDFLRVALFLRGNDGHLPACFGKAVHNRKKAAGRRAAAGCRI